MEREYIVPGAAKSTRYMNAYDLLCVEPNLDQTVSVEEATVPSPVDYKLYAVSILELRILDLWVVPINPWVLGKILDFF